MQREQEPNEGPLLAFLAGQGAFVFSVTHMVRLAGGLLLLSLISCGGSTDVSITGPTLNRCAVTATTSASPVPSAGGSGTVVIDTERECEWTAASEANWLTLSSAKGQGPGSVGYSAVANPDSSSRRGSIVVGQQRLEIAQEPAPCRYEVAPTTITAAAQETRTRIAITTAGGCRWSAQSTVPWVRADPPEAVGTGTLELSIAENTGPERASTISLAGVTVAITQAAPPPVACTYGVAPATLEVPAAGGQSALTVTTSPAECVWTATPDMAWITILEGTTGRGPGTVRVSVAANEGARRSGAILVGGRSVGVSQDARQSCTYSISPTSHSVGREGASVAVEVTATANCSWTSTSESPWISVSAGSSGSSSGIVTLVVAPNPAEARAGRVLIAGQVLVIQQAGTVQCSYSLKPTYYDAGRGPDDVTIQVTATPGCPWTVTGEPGWVTVAEGRTGSGNGTVRLLLSANTGGSRSASLTIAGQPFALSQEPGTCTTTIKPASYNSGRGPDEFEIEVIAPSGCPWTATSPVQWARIQSGASGSGTGTVNVRVNPNNEAARSTELTIAGHRFTLTQAGR